MQLSTVMLHVADSAALEACREWYARLGLMQSDYVPDESAFFDAGAGTLIGIHIEEDASPGAATVYLTVTNADGEYERLMQVGIDPATAPEDRFWGRVFYLRDPAGHRIGIVQPAGE
jgi:uncharacterized glyoxalase superfamily protein PhnB